MRLGISDAVLQSYGGAGSEDVRLPSSGLEGEIVESSPSG